MDARTRAIDAILAITTEGPGRQRAIDAVAQIVTYGTPFKIFLNGTKRQGDVTLKLLKDAGVIVTETRAKPGVKATYVVTEAFREEAPAKAADEKQDAHTEFEPVPFQSYLDAYELLDELEESWKTPALKSYEQLRTDAVQAGLVFDGKLGDALDTVIWTVSLMREEGGVTIDDFSLEGRFHVYKERTLRLALAQLKAAGIISVKRVPHEMAIYTGIFL